MTFWGFFQTTRTHNYFFETVRESKLSEIDPYFFLRKKIFLTKLNIKQFLSIFNLINRLLFESDTNNNNIRNFYNVLNIS